MSDITLALSRADLELIIVSMEQQYDVAYNAMLGADAQGRADDVEQMWKELDQLGGLLTRLRDIFFRTA